LVLVPFMWIFLGAIDLGRYFFTVQSMVTLLTDSQRAVMIITEDYLVGADGLYNCYDLGSWSTSLAIATPPLLVPASGQACISFLDVQNRFGGVQQIQVTVTYPFTTITPGLSGWDSTLSESATYSY